MDGVEQKLDDVMGTGFVLLAIGGNAADTLRGLRAEIWENLAATPVAISLDGNPSKTVDLNSVTLDPEKISPRFMEYDGWTLLVRPDRYVAAAFTRGNVAKIETALQNWMPN
tara:strand:- start:590 stop:925 length:336 start_codon:yes stop_codon:yes gene_type:complete